MQNIGLFFYKSDNVSAILYQFSPIISAEIGIVNKGNTKLHSLKYRWDFLFQIDASGIWCC
jgi:hypothetical protein